MKEAAPIKRNPPLLLIWFLKSRPPPFFFSIPLREMDSFLIFGYRNTSLASFEVSLSPYGRPLCSLIGEKAVASLMHHFPFEPLGLRNYLLPSESIPSIFY